MIIKNLEDDKLLKYMKVFNELSQIEKNKINFIIYKNHLMYLKENNKEKFAYYYKFLDTILDMKIIENKVQIPIKTLQDIVCLFNDYMKNTKTFFEDSLRFNEVLINNGLCPLILYAFSDIIFKPLVTKKDIKEIIEFSLMYLYRVIDNKEMNLKEEVLFNNTGAVSNIYLSDSKVIKIPKTLASRLFLMQQEFETYNYLKHTDLKKFLANNYKFDMKNKIVSHDFVDGENGEFYLFKHIKLQEEQLNSLKQFYESYKKLPKKLILDIHPGNFIWEAKKSRWVIVDLGLLPSVGSWYYDYNTFDDYFDMIWLKREETMQNIPIRSLDLEFDLNVKDKILKKLMYRKGNDYE